MHILLVSSYHASVYTGGNERYTHTLASLYRQMKHQVSYLANSGNVNFKTYPLIQLVDKNWFAKITCILQAVDNADIVHGCGFGFLVTLTGFIALIKHKPRVLTFQAPLNPKNPLKYWLAKLSELIDFSLYGQVICTSPKNEAYVGSRLINGKATTILLAAPSTFTPSTQSKAGARRTLGLENNKHYVLFVGALDRHHYYKGGDVLIDSMKQLDDTFHALLIGDGELKSNESDKFSVIGKVSDSQLALYYKAADVLVLPSTSTSEGFGLVLLEAMLSKLPIITTSAVGISSVIQDKKIGMIVPPKNSSLLAKAIETAMYTKSELLEQAYEFAQHNTTEHMAQKTLSYYSRVL